MHHFSPGEKVSFQDQGLPDRKFRVCNTVHDRGLHGIDERLEEYALVQLDVLRSFLSNMKNWAETVVNRIHSHSRNSVKIDRPRAGDRIVRY